MREFPMFFGAEHQNPELKKEIKGLLEKYSVKGTRLFIELTPDQVRLVLLKGEAKGPFGEAVLEACKKGIKIVPLERQSISTVSNEILFEFPEAYKYVLFDVRERHWKQLIKRNARKRDIVIMHPAHLKRIQKAMGIPKSRAIYFPGARKTVMKPLSAKELKKLKTMRKKAREQRRQAAMAKRKPK